MSYRLIYGVDLTRFEGQLCLGRIPRDQRRDSIQLLLHSTNPDHSIFEAMQEDLPIPFTLAWWSKNFEENSPVPMLTIARQEEIKQQFHQLYPEKTCYLAIISFDETKNLRLGYGVFISHLDLPKDPLRHDISLSLQHDQIFIGWQSEHTTLTDNTTTIVSEISLEHQQIVDQEIRKITDQPCHFYVLH